MRWRSRSTRSRRSSSRGTEFFHLQDGRGLRLETDVFGKDSGEAWPLATIFQLRGQAWTQVAADIRVMKGQSLAQFLARELSTRCLCIEVTDDAYYAHGLYDRGTIEEFVISATNLDIEPSLKALGLEVPAEYVGLDHTDFDEADYEYRREGKATWEAKDLAVEVGCYLHTPFSSEGSTHGVGDLVAEEVVRMDVIWTKKS